MNIIEARAKFQTERSWFAERGVSLFGATSYIPDDRESRLAMDAQPGLSTDPNSGVPAMLTTYIDPAIYEILFAPNKAAEILGEERKGDWLTETTMFPVVEATGEVTSYGDYNENGRAGANTNWPQFQSYLWQSIIRYGDREVEREGLARINWLSQLQKATAEIHARYANLTYLFGVNGLQNYGLTNDPDLPAPATPAPKSNGGVTWFTSSGAPNATATEVYNDILTIYANLVLTNQGNVDEDTPLVLALSPLSGTALKFTNSFGVNVAALLKENFSNLRIVKVPQYGAVSATNPQGIAAGNLVQLVAETISGQKTGFCAFNEKMRSHRLVPATSSFRQKTTGGSWGTVIRMPMGITQMVGV